VPRQIRIEYAGAIYHVLSRGDRREDIFLRDIDRQDFLRTLAEACEKADWQVHAYCLMRNHFHLVLETPNANLVSGMSWLLSTYTNRLNKRHKLVGHVFSGRYKALLVDGNSDGGYLKTVCDYTHLNPIRAKLLQIEDRLISYPWSSLIWYLAATEHRPSWMRVDRLLGEHGIQDDHAKSRQEFETRMEARRLESEDEESLRRIRRGWYLGSDEFKGQMIERMDSRLTSNHNRELRQEDAQAKGRRILSEELARLGWSAEDLVKRAKSHPEKLAIGARLRKETTLPVKDIAALAALGTSNTANTNLHQWMRGNRESR
jgi:putative transposase